MNGVEAKRCSFSEEYISEEVVTFESLQGDVCLSVDCGYIVKYVMTAEGEIFVRTGFIVREDKFFIDRHARRS